MIYAVATFLMHDIPYSAIMCLGENIGEFGKLTAICQCSTYWYFPYPIGTYFYNFVLKRVLELPDHCYICLLNIATIYQ